MNLTGPIRILPATGPYMGYLQPFVYVASPRAAHKWLAKNNFETGRNAGLTANRSFNFRRLWSRR